MATMESRTLSVRIDRDLRDVYDFVSLPENFPRWATGLGTSIAKVNDEWIAQTSHGPMTVRFTERNAFGVLDHYVGSAPDAEVSIPMRVIRNGSGSELILTVFRALGTTDNAFAEDVAWVERDLQALKALLEA